VVSKNNVFFKDTISAHVEIAKPTKSFPIRKELQVEGGVAGGGHMSHDNVIR